MIKVSDYIFQRLKERGITQAFMVAGGGAMHLDDSLGRSGINYTCCHHEQACAIAAEGYARLTGKPAVVVVTSGPGGTNCLTGVIGQWLDSVPCIYISGNMKRELMGAGRGGLRQLGDQEINIIDIVKPVTKFAEVVTRPWDISWFMDKAVYYAMQGRPGPVWLDVPLDVQSATIQTGPEGVIGFPDSAPPLCLRASVADVADLLHTSSRPLFLAGHGIRISGAKDEFIALAEKLGIPVVTSFNGMDLIPSDHPLYTGRIGTIGTRSGNRALRECDLLISIGSRNNIRQVSYDWKNFAPQAKKIVVDIDAAELGKPTVVPDLAVRADAGEFIKALKESGARSQEPGGWARDCMSWRNTATGRTVPLEGVDPYRFIETLTSLLSEDTVIVSGNGTASIALHQVGIVKKNTRVIMNSGCAAMGYDLPAAIGACIANGGTDVVCITGDGSIQMNIQELQTIVHHKLPIKIFVLSNGGYHSIRQTQDNYFEGRHVGAGPQSGVSCPEILKIADAYDITSAMLPTNVGLSLDIGVCLNIPGPVLCDVRLTRDYKFDKLAL